MAYSGEGNLIEGAVGGDINVVVPLVCDSTGHLLIGTGGPIVVTGTISSNPTVYSRSDSYTAAGTGVAVDVSSTTAKYFSIQVRGVAVGASTWSVVLEGSIDGTNYTTILTHNTATLDKIILFSGATASPSLYFRSRCVNLSLGSATSIVVVILGTS